MTEMRMVERTSERDPDAVIDRLAAVALARQEPVRVRMQPTVMDHETKSYVALPQVRWILDLPNGDEVKALKAGLDLYFELMEKLGGAQAMFDYLGECKVAIVGGDAARD
jgi:hypothetical protein